MTRIRLLIVLSAISLLMAVTTLAAWGYQSRQGNWVPLRHSAFQFATNDEKFRFFLPAQTVSKPGFPPMLAYRVVLSLPLWPVISAGFVLPIICVGYLITGKPSTKRGFEVAEPAIRPLT